MATQSQLEADIAAAQAQVNLIQGELDAALSLPSPDPADIADLQASLAIAQSNLAQLQNQLDVLTVADPYVSSGTSTIAPIIQNPVPKTATGYNYPVGADGSTPYDDNGNLNYNWQLNEYNDPVYVGPISSTNPSSTGASKGLQGQIIQAQSQATLQDVVNFQQSGDWRVKLKLAKGVKYLYGADDPGILLPLKQSDGVIFPYTPQVNVSYSAHYDPTDLTHSNYKIHQYKSSSVDQISITCEFTAQDTFEANYMLAVIHFFRSVTKMFYGQDQNPNNGVPPPLCYLTGLGAFQFDNHPIAITNFNYNLPNDVDYIRAGSATTNAGVNLSAYENKADPNAASAARLYNSNLQVGAMSAPPLFAFASAGAGTRQPTYVPTKMQITIQAVPIVSRGDISNEFSLKKYATGQLLQGSIRSSGGIW